MPSSTDLQGGDSIEFDDQNIDLTGVRDLRGIGHGTRRTPMRYQHSSDATDAALEALAETGQTYAPRLSEVVQQNGIDVSSLYGEGKPTKKAAAYEAQATSFDAPANPRQADHASDEGGTAGKLERIARQYVGIPYVWGGSTPDGFDCSGLVQYVFRKVGINLPRVSYQQAQSGTAVSARQARAGDIVWWDNSMRNNGADHVAVLLGGGLILEAPRPGVASRIRRLADNEGAHFTRVL